MNPELDDRDWQVIFTALMDAPWKVANPVLNKIGPWMHQRGMLANGGPQNDLKVNIKKAADSKS